MLGLGQIESDCEVIVLRTVPENPSLTKEQGVWVLYTGDPLPGSAIDEVVQQIREEHDLANRGNGG